MSFPSARKVFQRFDSTREKKIIDKFPVKDLIANLETINKSIVIISFL